MIRMCFKFGVSGGLIFVSHLGKLKTFAQALRRADIPVKYSSGYNPRPRLSLTVPLPVGMSSSGEYGEVGLKSDIYTEEFFRRLAASLPPGLKLMRAKKQYTKKPSLASLLNCARYRISLKTDATLEQLQRAVDSLTSADSLKIPKRGGEKEVDIRPGIYDIELVDLKDQTAELALTCGVSHYHNVRPEDVISLSAKDVGELETLSLHREGLYLRTEDGELREPF